MKATGIPQRSAQRANSTEHQEPSLPVDARTPSGASSPGQQSPSPALEAAPAAVSFRAVSKAFLGDDTAHLAIHDIDLEVTRGRFVCLLGPSGCGKSTLLNLAAGLTTASSGEVLIDGEQLHGVNNAAGFITQKDNLLPWRTVRRNIEICLEIRGVPRRTRRAAVDEMIERVGLQGFAEHYPSQLSGGMRKRVTLARTLIYEPEILLMDEPFGALDAQLRASMQAELLRLWERDRKTVLFVTHDVEEALLLADEVLVFGTKPGRIISREEVTLERPRSIDDLSLDAEFIAKVRDLRTQLAGADEGKQLS
jgi:NitT/TauT family transport system ATP-binding protein